MSGDRTATFEEQYEALRSGCGVVELTQWSSVTVTGADRQSFVNSFCTNDIKRLKPSDSCEAFFLNVKGKIVGHGLVTCRDEELVFIGAPGQAQQLVEHLDRYLIREDVQLQDSTHERIFVISAAAVDITVVSFPWNLIGDEAARIFEYAPLKMPFLHRLISQRGLPLVGLPGFNAARIEAGVPLFGLDFGGHNLPQEVGRDKPAISFTKGCYLGQETVARIDALGHVNQRIVGVRFFGADVPEVGAELSQLGATVGRVSSASFSPKLGAPLALAMVRREANVAGTRLESAAGECEVIELPLI